MGWTCQLLEGLEELSFKFERCGGTFKRMKIINRTSSRALEDLERSNWALNEEKLEENGLGGDWIRSGLSGLSYGGPKPQRCYIQGPPAQQHAGRARLCRGNFGNPFGRLFEEGWCPSFGDSWTSDFWRFSLEF